MFDGVHMHSLWEYYKVKPVFVFTVFESSPLVIGLFDITGGPAELASDAIVMAIDLGSESAGIKERERERA